MAEDLKLEIVIQALLDAKGFEEAKANIAALSATANQSAPVIERAGDAAKKMGDSYSATRAPVAAVTGALLTNTGVTVAAGEAAQATGAATYFLNSAISATVATVAQMTLGVGLLLPLIIDWIRSNKDNEEAQADFNQQIDIGLDRLNKLMAAAPGVSQTLENLRKALQGEKVQSQADALAAMRVELVRIEGELRTATGTIERYEQAVARGFTATYAPAEEARRAVERLTREKEALIAKARALEEAMLDGTTVGGQYKQIMDAIAEADKKPMKERKKEVERLTAAQKEAIDQDIRARIDIVRFTEKANRDKKKADDAEAQRILDYQALQRDAMLMDQQLAEQKRLNALTAVSYAGQAFTALSVLFGRNKALAIAGAIADTYAAANLALRTIPPPAGWAAAAASIAMGLANVQSIRKSGGGDVGFDDPFSDLTARRLGRRSAIDFVDNFGAEFIPGVRRGMAGAMRGGGASYSTTNNHYSTTNVNALKNRTEFRKFLAVEMAEANRLEGRRTIGR